MSKPKKMKTAHHPPADLPDYRYSPSNVFAHMQTGPGGNAAAVFDRPSSFAFLEATRPLSLGHAVLVIKHAAATLLDDVPPGVMAAAMQDLQALSRAVQGATKCEGLKLLQNSGPQAGQTVPQLHFHLVPCYKGKPDPLQSSAAGAAQPGDAEAGPVAAAVRNLLPPEYSGPGLHVWAPSAEAMEQLGVSMQQGGLGRPGTVVLLNGHLGAGKSTISRGFVRAACRDPALDVPSPTFLLCLSYKEDLGHDPEARASEQEQPPTVHHMDPYRLGAKADKMAGLIDFGAAFERDVCLVEWPDRMPKEVMKLPMRGVSIQVSGTGIQAAGRLVSISPLSPEDPSAELLASWRKAGAAPVPEMQWRAPGETGGAPTGPDAAASSWGSAGAALMRPLPPDASKWVVLGIESSCDDTAAAVVTGDGAVCAHRIASQAGLHEQFGGVKPDVARDAHAQAIKDTVQGCLEEAGVKPEDLSAVAVTVGPGLSLCLQVGVQHALEIAALHRLPFVPVHHMEAHALMTRLPSVNPAPTSFPCLILLVSGGHNMLVYCEGVGRHRIIGTTLDDSAGECFDKIARLVGITSVPGGPKLEALADEGTAMLQALAESVASDTSSGATDEERRAAGAKAAAKEGARFEVTMPMQGGQHSKSCNFSFSGMKTSVAKLIETERKRLGLPATLYTGPGASTTTGKAAVAAEGGDEPSQADPEVAEQLHRSTCLIAAGFQKVAVKFLQQRARRALEWLKEDAAQQGTPAVTCLVVAGGVAANKAVRGGLQAVAAEFGVPCVCPPVKHCTDNGLMVAWTGVERLHLGLYKAPPPMTEEAIRANVDVLPRWPIGPVDPRSAAGLKYVKQFH